MKPAGRDSARAQGPIKTPSVPLHSPGKASPFFSMFDRPIGSSAALAPLAPSLEFKDVPAKPDVLDFEQAVTEFERGMELALGERGTNDDPFADERGVALNFLGNALERLGSRESGTASVSDGGKPHFGLRLFAPPFRPSDLTRGTSGVHDCPLIGWTEGLGKSGQCSLDEPRFEGDPCGFAVRIEFLGHSQRLQGGCDASGVYNYPDDAVRDHFGPAVFRPLQAPQGMHALQRCRLRPPVWRAVAERPRPP